MPINGTESLKTCLAIALIAALGWTKNMSPLTAAVIPQFLAKNAGTGNATIHADPRKSPTFDSSKVLRMADNTKIESTDATLNAINGCSLKSPGCTNCYAMKQAHRFEVRRGLTEKTKGGISSLLNWRACDEITVF